MNSPQASNRATLQVNRMMIVSFFLMEISRRKILLVFISGPHLDHPRQLQEIRADLKPGTPRPGDVDHGLNHGLADAETDDASEAREAVGLPDGHDARFSQRRQDLLQAAQLGRSD